MAVRGKSVFKLGLAIGLAALVVVLIAHFIGRYPLTISGAVVTDAPDPTKELPIADVEVTLTGAFGSHSVHSDASGFFNMAMQPPLPLTQPIMLHFRHPDYLPLDMQEVGGDKLYIAHLTPRAHAASDQRSEATIAHVVAKYFVNATTKVNIGSAVKTLQVVNTGNVGCEGHSPCSPDGRWKAATANTEIDAGAGNEFHNARASCIAGPCPFTRMEDALSSDSQTFRVNALDWSDTATFLLEAEVFKRIMSDVLVQSYPVIFDRALTFTLPGAAVGVSVQAELDGTTIIFPLGPSLSLSWANCQVAVNKDQTKVYRCELKSGYRLL
jgi:hypothetical protein